MNQWVKRFLRAGDLSLSAKRPARRETASCGVRYWLRTNNLSSIRKVSYLGKAAEFSKTQPLNRNEFAPSGWFVGRQAASGPGPVALPCPAESGESSSAAQWISPPRPPLSPGRSPDHPCAGSYGTCTGRSAAGSPGSRTPALVASYATGRTRGYPESQSDHHRPAGETTWRWSWCVHPCRYSLRPRPPAEVHPATGSG